MSTLIFQIHIKSWDKSQRSSEHVAKRAAMANRFAIETSPEFFILNQSCIIDCHGHSKNRPLKKAMLSDGSVKLERFIISKQDGLAILKYQDEQTEPLVIGSLNKGWLQATYQWRYALEEANEIYWQYEEVTLNAVCIEEYDSHYFLNSQPQQEFFAPE